MSNKPTKIIGLSLQQFVSLCLILANYKKQTMTSIGLFYKNVRECVDCLTCEELVGVTHRR